MMTNCGAVNFLVHRLLVVVQGFFRQQSYPDLYFAFQSRHLKHASDAFWHFLLFARSNFAAPLVDVVKDGSKNNVQQSQQEVHGMQPQLQKQHQSSLRLSHNSYLFWILWEPFTVVDVFCASSKQNYPVPLVELWFIFCLASDHYL